MDHSSMQMAEMPSYLHIGSMETILFAWWMPETILGMFGSCLLILIFSFISETIRWFRAYRRAQRALDLPMTSADRLLYSPRVQTFQLINAGFYFFEVLLSACLMLVLMTFNIWLGLSVVIGQVDHFS